MLLVHKILIFKFYVLLGDIKVFTNPKELTKTLGYEPQSSLFTRTHL